MTLWRPDTCECEIEYSDPDMSLMKVHNRCSKHDGPHDDASHFDMVLSHNRKKNSVHNAVIDHLNLTDSKVPPGMVSTFYDNEDNLHVKGSGLDVLDKKTISTKVSDILGSTSLNIEN